ncbi:hypothetical protein VQH23_04095 [Pararoseomonas sp. SCSIO 73927]|uniref:hypothetical protein n=1 Tax=Pararoseomonas sp. SCSIO 73927 TaxID=3114537 RepID=UPI0030CF8559
MIYSSLPLLPAAALLLALGLARPAASQDVVLDARAQTRIEQKAVLPEPAYRLAWDSADKSFWIVGETAKPARDLAGRATAGGTGSLGARYHILGTGPLSLSTTPVLRAEASWAGDGGARHVLGAAVYQEVGLSLPQGLTLRAKGGLGDPTGLSAAGGDTLPTGLAFRAEAAISGDLSPLGDPGTRFNLQLVSTHSLAGLDHSDFTARCEMRLELSRKGTAPLGIGTSCPGTGGEDWVTLTVAGRF